MSLLCISICRPGLSVLITCKELLLERFVTNAPYHTLLFLIVFFNTVNNTFLRCLDLRWLLVLCLKAAGISILKEQSSVSEINGRSQSILFKRRAAFPSENQVWVAC